MSNLEQIQADIEKQENEDLDKLYRFIREAGAEYARSIQPRPVEENLTLYEYDNDLQINDIRS